MMLDECEIPHDFCRYEDEMKRQLADFREMLRRTEAYLSLLRHRGVNSVPQYEVDEVIGAARRLLYPKRSR